MSFASDVASDFAAILEDFDDTVTISGTPYDCKVWRNAEVILDTQQMPVMLMMKSSDFTASALARNDTVTVTSELNGLSSDTFIARNFYTEYGKTTLELEDGA